MLPKITQHMLRNNIPHTKKLLLYKKQYSKHKLAMKASCVEQTKAGQLL